MPTVEELIEQSRAEIAGRDQAALNVDDLIAESMAEMQQGAAAETGSSLAAMREPYSPETAFAYPQYDRRPPWDEAAMTALAEENAARRRRRAAELEEAGRILRGEEPTGVFGEGDRGIRETLRRKRWSTLIPVGGALAEGLDTLRAYEDMQYLEDVASGKSPKPTFYDEGYREFAGTQRRTEDFLIRLAETKARGKTVPAAIIEGILNMFPYMAEFIMSGGIATGAREISKTAATKLLKGAAKRRIGQLAVRGAGWTAAGMARAGTTMAGRAVKGYAERRLGQPVLTEEGRVILEGSKGPFESAFKAYGSTVIEAMSEEAGEVLMGVAGRVVKRMPGAQKIGKRMGAALARVWVKSGKTESFKAGLKRLGYHGVLGEMGEEWLGAAMQAVTGVEDFGLEDDKNTVFNRIVAAIPSGKETLVMFGIFLFPGAVRGGVGLATAAAARREARRPAETAALKPTRKAFPDIAKKADRVAAIDAAKAQVAAEQAKIAPQPPPAAIPEQAPAVAPEAPEAAAPPAEKAVEPPEGAKRTIDSLLKRAEAEGLASELGDMAETGNLPVDDVLADFFHNTYPLMSGKGKTFTHGLFKEHVTAEGPGSVLWTEADGTEHRAADWEELIRFQLGESESVEQLESVNQKKLVGWLQMLNEAARGGEMAKPLPKVLLAPLERPKAEKAKERPFTIGQSVEVETLGGWVKGKVEGYRSTEPDEDFERISVRTDAGRFYADADPKSVREVPLERKPAPVEKVRKPLERKPKPEVKGQEKVFEKEEPKLFEREPTYGKAKGVPARAGEVAVGEPVRTTSDLQKAIDEAQERLSERYPDRRDSLTEREILDEMHTEDPIAAALIEDRGTPYRLGQPVRYKGKPYSIARHNPILDTFDLRPSRTLARRKMETNISPADLTFVGRQAKGARPERGVTRGQLAFAEKAKPYRKKPLERRKRMTAAERRAAEIEKTQIEISSLEAQVKRAKEPAMAQAAREHLEKLRAIAEGEIRKEIPAALKAELERASPVELARRVTRLGKRATPEMKLRAAEIRNAEKVKGQIRKRVQKQRDWRLFGEREEEPVLDWLRTQKIAYGQRPRQIAPQLSTEITEALSGKGRNVKQYFWKLRRRDAIEGKGYAEIGDLLDQLKSANLVPQDMTDSGLLEHIIARAESIGPQDFESRLKLAAEEEMQRMEEYGVPEEEGFYTKHLAAYDRVDTAEIEAQGKLAAELGRELSETGTPTQKELAQMEMDIGRLEATMADLRKTAAVEADKALEGMRDKLKTLEGEEPLKALRKQIIAEAYKKGFTKTTRLGTQKAKQLREIIRQASGREQGLTKIRDQGTLEKILKSVMLARPKRIGQKIVITGKTERKIADLRDNFIRRGKLTADDWKRQLAELKIEVPGYIGPQQFITEKQGHELIRKMLDESFVIRHRQEAERALKDKPGLRAARGRIRATIEAKQTKREEKGKLAKAARLLDMRYYMQRLEERSGIPGIYDLYRMIMNQKLQNQFMIEREWDSLVDVVGSKAFRAVYNSKEADKRIVDYIESEKYEEIEAPADITEDEVKIAEAVKRLLRTYQPRSPKAKFQTLYDWYGENMVEHSRELLPDAPKEEVRKALDILESQGYDALDRYLEARPWGYIGKGYAPRELTRPMVHLSRLAPTSYAKGHIQVRQGLEFEDTERTLLQRLHRYMFQMRNLTTMPPLVRAFGRLFDENPEKFADPRRTFTVASTWLNEVRGYPVEGGELYRWLRRLYSDFISIRLAFPDKWGRNLLQPAAFYPDKTDLVNPKNKTLNEADREYFHTYVSQQLGLGRDYFFYVEPPKFLGLVRVPGYNWAMDFIRRHNLYMHTDEANRWVTFWAKTNSARRAVSKHWTKDKEAGALLNAVKLQDLEPLQQIQIIETLAARGEDAAVRELGRMMTENTQWVYDRSQRAPMEHGAIGRLMLPLFNFMRSYWQRTALNVGRVRISNLKNREGVRTAYRGAKWAIAMLVGGWLLGELHKKIWGKKRNPYSPGTLAIYSPEGSGEAILEPAETFVRNLIWAVERGDAKYVDGAIQAGTELADLAVPFYEVSMNIIEGVTGTMSWDRLQLRRIRSRLDPEYQPRESHYEVQRSTVEFMQKVISGSHAGEQPEKKGKKLSLPLARPKRREEPKRPKARKQLERPRGREGLKRPKIRKRLERPRRPSG